MDTLQPTRQSALFRSSHAANLIRYMLQIGSPATEECG